MGKTGIVAAVLVVMALSGCSAGGEQATAKEAAPAASTTPSATPTPVAAPIASAPVAPDARTPAQIAGFKDENDWFLRSIRSGWTGDVPTEGQLLGAGALACQEMNAGTSQQELVVVTGDDEAAIQNNRNLVDAARVALCPLG